MTNPHVSTDDESQPQFVDAEVAHDLISLFIRHEPQPNLRLAVHAGLYGGIPPRPHLDNGRPCPGVLTLNRGLGWSFVMYDRGDAMDIGPIYRGPARRYIDLAVRA